MRDGCDYYETGEHALVGRFFFVRYDAAQCYSRLKDATDRRDTFGRKSC